MNLEYVVGNGSKAKYAVLMEQDFVILVLKIGFDNCRNAVYRWILCVYIADLCLYLSTYIYTKPDP